MRGRSKQMILGLVFTAIAPLSGLQGQTGSPGAEAAPRPKPVLVELFTSEGCSSCPPADALLRQIDGTRTSAGQWIVGISEHVTYWNSLGWSDPFSSLVYTDRQSAYGARFGVDSVYTPQMVVNGGEQFVGSDRAGLLRALEKEQRQPDAVTFSIQSVTQQGTMLTVAFNASGAIPSHGVDIIAVVTDDSQRSSVSKGENSGRTLVHVSVARSLQRVATLRAAAQQTVQIPLPSGFQSSTAHHLILFAQIKGAGRVLGTDSRPF